MSKFEKDLSQGSVTKLLIKFALPFLLSNLVQSLYNVADMLIVGNISGTNSMAGVNIGGQVTFILTNIIAGLCTGGTVIIAQQLGAKDRKAVQETISTLMTVLLIASVVTTAVMLALKDPFLRLLQTPKEAFEESSNYLLVTVTGIIFIFLYNALSAIMRGMGDSKRPFYFILVACVTNIVLDLVLVGGFKMGATGAAIATVFSQALSVVLCIVFLKKNDFPFDFKIKSYKPHRGRIGKLFTVGLPTAVQNGIVGLSFLFITSLVNSIGGVDGSAAVGVVSKINSFAILPAVAMSSSVSAMAAQNIGAGLWDRAKKTFHVGMVCAIVISYTIFVIIQLFPEQIIVLFDSSNPNMVDIGVSYVRTLSLDYLFVPMLFCLNALFVGAGHTTISLTNSILSSVAIRVPLAYVFGVTLGMGVMGIGLAAPAATLGSLAVGTVFYLSKKWMTSKIVN